MCSLGILSKSLLLTITYCLVEGSGGGGGVFCLSSLCECKRGFHVCHFQSQTL